MDVLEPISPETPETKTPELKNDSSALVVEFKKTPEVKKTGRNSKEKNPS
jgi:hypothetical protein